MCHPVFFPSLARCCYSATSRRIALREPRVAAAFATSSTQQHDPKSAAAAATSSMSWRDTRIPCPTTAHTASAPAASVRRVVVVAAAAERSPYSVGEPDGGVGGCCCCTLLCTYLRDAPPPQQQQNRQPYCMLAGVDPSRASLFLLNPGRPNARAKWT